MYQANRNDHNSVTLLSLSQLLVMLFPSSEQQPCLRAVRCPQLLWVRWPSQDSGCLCVPPRSSPGTGTETGLAQVAIRASAFTPQVAAYVGQF